MEEADSTEFHVSEEFEGKRIDKVLSQLCGDSLSRARLQTLIKDGDVMLNGRACHTASRRVRVGDSLAFTIPEPEEAEPQPQDIPLDILYEDEDLLVLNKPAGLVVHPGAGNADGTLVNALLAHCAGQLSGIGGVKRPGIVHRLDKETSGLMMVAKNDLAHRHLSAQLQDRSLSRRYIAYVWNVPRLTKDSINSPIGRHATQRLKMAVMKSSGKDAITHYSVLEKYGSVASKIECVLESGRTHQIRVHMQFAGHPLIGDPLYGLPDQEGRAKLKNRTEAVDIESIMTFPRQALHAYDISFQHPADDRLMNFKCHLPEDLQIMERHLETVL